MDTISDTEGMASRHNDQGGVSFGDGGGQVLGGGGGVGTSLWNERVMKPIKMRRRREKGV